MQWLTLHLPAAGAVAKRLDFPGAGEVNGFWNKGISACAVCDGAAPMFRRAENPCSHPAPSFHEGAFSQENQCMRTCMHLIKRRAEGAAWLCAVWQAPCPRLAEGKESTTLPKGTPAFTLMALSCEGFSAAPRCAGTDRRQGGASAVEPEPARSFAACPGARRWR